MSSPSPTEETASGGQTQTEARRPIGVTAFAIPGSLFGVIGLLSYLGSLLLFFFRDSIPLPASPVDKLVDDSIGYQVYYLTTSGLGIVFSAILLTAGFGLLLNGCEFLLRPIYRFGRDQDFSFSVLGPPDFFDLKSNR